MLLSSLILVCLLIPVSAFPTGRASKTIFFDDFNGRFLSQGWTVENLGGNYSLSHSMLTMSTSGPAITVYRQFIPETDNFTITARVESRLLASFALRIQASPPPIFGGTVGAQLEFDTGRVENKNFLAAWEPSGGGWTWSTFYSPSATDTWYVLEMKVQRNPFSITYSVYNGAEDNSGQQNDQGQVANEDQSGALLGTFTTTAMGFSYDSIKYVALEAWSAPLTYDIDWVRISASNVLLFDDFTHGHPRSQVAGVETTWAGRGEWNLNHVDGSTVWFPSKSIATFSSFFTNFIYSPYGVSITSKANWTVQSRVVLLVHVMALNYTRGPSTWYGPDGGADAWRADLSWGSAGSANIGYGTDSVHSPNTGLTVGGECIERTPQGVLTTNNLIGQWITANITLSAPTQTVYFSAYDSNGNTLGHTSTTGFCGTMFGSLPVNIDFWTYFGTSDIDWIRLTS